MYVIPFYNATKDFDDEEHGRDFLKRASFARSCLFCRCCLRQGCFLLRIDLRPATFCYNNHIHAKVRKHIRAIP